MFETKGNKCSCNLFQALYKGTRPAVNRRCVLFRWFINFWSQSKVCHLQTQKCRLFACENTAKGGGVGGAGEKERRFHARKFGQHFCVCVKGWGKKIRNMNANHVETCDDRRCMRDVKVIPATERGGGGETIIIIIIMLWMKIKLDIFVILLEVRGKESEEGSRLLDKPSSVIGEGPCFSHNELCERVSSKAKCARNSQLVVILCWTLWGTQPVYRIMASQAASSPAY